MEKIKIDNIIRHILDDLKNENFLKNDILNPDLYIRNDEFAIAEKGIHIDNNTLARSIDHTMLKPEATNNDIKKLCEEASENNFKSVCVNPSQIINCKKYLTNQDVSICTVIGFPLGVNNIAVKQKEAEEAIELGATELDMVNHVGKLKEKDYYYFYSDIHAVTSLKITNPDVLVKVILETCLLTEEEIIAASLIAKIANADFVKTSTGFNKAGADYKDVALMKYVVGNDMSVKASGGIRTRKDAELMIANGASRIGASSGIAILNENI